MTKAFNRMWFSSIAYSFADGLVVTAVPLLGVKLTDDPFLIALLSAMSFLPWLLLAISSGIVVDRVNRRLVLAASNALRFFVIGLLAVVVGAGRAEIWLLLVACFLMGWLDTLSDSAAVAMTPTLAGPGQLDRANARIQGAQVVVRNFVAAPAAAWLFAWIAAVPFALAGASFGAAALFAVAIPAVALKAGAVVASRSAAARRAGADSADEGRHVLAEAGTPGGPDAIRVPPSELVDPAPAAATDEPAHFGAMDGLRFLWRHPRLRPLWICSTLVGVGVSFSQATYVMFALNVLGVPEEWFGLLSVAFAVGGLLGAMTARQVSEALGRGSAMVLVSVANALSFVAIGLLPSLWGFVPFAIIGTWAVGVWNVLAMSGRQQLMPKELMGRIHGVWRTAMWGAMPIATALGGLVSRWSLHSVWIIGGVFALLVTIAYRKTLFSFNAADAPDIVQH